MKKLLFLTILVVPIFAAKWSIEESPRKMTWIEGKDFCRSKNAKLPTLTDMRKVSKTSFKKYFKNDFYWTRTENRNDLNNAYYFDFSSNRSYDSPKKFTLNIRCVY